MPAPEFFAGLPSGLTDKSQSSTAWVADPKAATTQNVAIPLDALGLAYDMDRETGESATQYRARIVQGLHNRGDASVAGFTRGICNELGLGQAALMTVTADRTVEIRVETTRVTAVGSGIDFNLVLFAPDPEGIWQYPSLATLASGLNDLPGITAVVEPTLSGLPALLLDPGTTRVTVHGEPISQVQAFPLGYWQPGDPNPGQVDASGLAFTDTTTFRTQVTGTPRAPGEWSYDATLNRVQVHDVPPYRSYVSYTYDTLVSGATVTFAGHGARVVPLVDSGVQALLFPRSGSGEETRAFLREIHAIDRANWGS